MANINQKKPKITVTAVPLVIIIILAALISGIIFVEHGEFHAVYEHMVLNWLGLVIDTLNLIGSFIILFGSILLALRYVKSKVKEPTRAIEFTPRARYLIVGLEILIGAEIINTAFTRTLEGFLILILTIATRGLIAILLHLEKKWGMHD